MENKQKELNKRLSKKRKTYSAYASPKFLTKKILVSDLPKALNVKKSNDTFISKDDKYNISVPLTSTGNIILKKNTAKALRIASKSKQDTYNFTISLPNKENNTFTGQAKVAKENSIVYKDYQENTDVVVQALKGSVRILTILNDADAPTEYVYDINVPIGGHMKKLENGAIAIYDKNKNFKGGFATPRAVDKNGKKVPTHFELEGNKLIQVVEHLNMNIEYPIVADPYAGDELIDWWEWKYWTSSDGKHYHNDWRLYVHTTFWARFYGGSYDAGIAGWYELKNKDRNLYNNITENVGSMANQYICHAQYGFYLPREYHLEEWRPWVDYDKMYGYNCNPPGHINHSW